MRGLHLLIELARRETDERQGRLGQLCQATAEADAALTVHEQGVADESRIAANDPAVMATLGAWSVHVARMRRCLQQRHAELYQDEAAARDALRSSFVDLKRLEMARDNAAHEARIAAMRRAEQQAQELYAVSLVPAA